MQLEENHKLTVAIIGGGRWGQVTLSVLASLNLPYNYVVVSNANYNRIKLQLATFESSLSTFSIVHKITDLLNHHEVTAAIVVNSAGEHFKTARMMLNYGIHVLIEKPIVLSINEMYFLIENASKKNLIIIPGLCYRFCSYVHHFAVEVEKQGTPHQFLFEWYDKKNEVRYDQTKIHDAAINVVQDVMPHVYMVLLIIFKLHPDALSCKLNADGDYAEIIISLGDVSGTIILNRNSFRRKRYLSVGLTSGKHISLDFTIEPGLITDGIKTRSGDDNWKNQPGPLAKQLHHFFSAINDNTVYKNDIDVCIQSVKCVDDILSHAKTR